MAKYTVSKDPLQRYEHFCETGQEALRLLDALEGFFDEGDSKPHRDTYASYIRKRRSSAGDELARQGDLERLWILCQKGILQEEDIKRLITRFQDAHHPAAWIRLILLKDALEHGIRPENGQAMLQQEGVKKPAPDKEERASSLALQYLSRCRSELYFLFPSLSEALSVFIFKAHESCQSLSTDGIHLFYREEWVVDTWQHTPQTVRRLFLHMLLHSLFQHIGTMDPEDPWETLAADMQAEFLIERECWMDEEKAKQLGQLPHPGLWSYIYEKEKGNMTAAAAMARRLKTMIAPKYLTEQLAVFHRDDHSLWDAAAAQLWQKMRDRNVGQGFGGIGKQGIGSVAGDRFDAIANIQKAKHDYRSYLQQFAQWQEAMETDPDSFDYSYYTLGMELFGDMPLIEQLEYREGHRLQQFVIAIDTSGSVKNDTVRRFLEEAYAILDEKENFFDKMEVWIIQCDCVIEDVVKITCRREWEHYLQNLRVIGRAGTDFRPVFKYIEKQQAQGEMTKLKGMLYFTDGDGAYPREEPPYQCAFAFLHKTPAMGLVPSWGKVLIVDEEIE